MKEKSTWEDKKIRIAFDLDGVVINKPPLIPKKLLEWLFRGRVRDGLSCRFPSAKLEQWVRKLSHFYFLRPPIKDNIKDLEKLSQSGKYELYAVSARYSFLKRETNVWMEKRKIKGLFKEIVLNLDNEQPHLFKERKLKELKPVFFVEDDSLIADYLAKKLAGIRIFCLYDQSEPCLNAQTIKSLKDLPLK